MSVNLAKGARVNLSKQSVGLNKIQIGLGWDPVDSGPQKKGLFGRIMSAVKGGEQDIDCDAWVCLLSDGKLEHNENLVWFFHKNYIYNEKVVVKHHGDNLTGAGDGDDEVISINLLELPPEIDSIIIGVTIFCGIKRNQNFANIQNTFIRVVDSRDNSEIVKYNQEDMSGGSEDVTFIAGRLYKENNEWSFEAIGKLTDDGSIEQAADRYR